MADLNFNELVLKHAPWSLSKIEVARQCGLRFHYKYILKKKEAAVDRSEGRVGAAAHKTVELLLKGEEVKRAFTVAAVDNKLTINEIDDLATFQGTLKGFLQRLEAFKNKTPVEKVFIEHQFGLTVDLKPTGFFGKDVFFRGVWDLGLHTKNGSLIVLDHKSGQKADTIEKYANQLNSYAIAGKVILPTIQGVQSAIHYMRDGSIVWGAYISAKEIDEKLIDWFVNYLNQSIAPLNDTATPGWYCGFCGYASICDAYKASKS